MMHCATTFLLFLGTLCICVAGFQIPSGFVRETSLFRTKDVYVRGNEKLVVGKGSGYADTHPSKVLKKLQIHQKLYEYPLPDDYWHFIPTYIGNVIPNSGQSISWSSPCFKKLSASASLTQNSNGDHVATIFLDVSEKTSFTCNDGYLLATIESFDIHYFEFDGNHSITFTGNFSSAELLDISTNGFRVFEFDQGVTMSLVDLWETVQLFLGALIGARVPEWTAEDNIQFLKDYASWNPEVRGVNLVDVPEDQIQSGWFLGIIRMDGLDPMLAWAMGSHTGHTAITLRMGGQLYVCESTVKSNYWPTDGVQMTPWKQWLQQAQTANYNVVLLPLSAQYQQLFNESQAIAWFNTVKGLPYGFHNMVFGWIDTAEDNYPPPLTSHLIQLVMVFLDEVMATFIDSKTIEFFQQALNHRLNTQGLSVRECFAEAQQRGLSFTDLVTIPEQDTWVYENDPQHRNGPSMVCDVLVLEMYKAAGIFGSITDTIQGTEFTNWDVYSLAIFDGARFHPQACINADPSLPYCQLMGKYRMTLPGFNTYAPFPHMREKCPGLPPSYNKPANC